MSEIPGAVESKTCYSVAAKLCNGVLKRYPILKPDVNLC